MTRTAPIVRWDDPQDPTVQQGLKLRCGACKAPPGTPCTNTVNGEPLSRIGRHIHHFRLDKALKDDKEPT